MEPTGRISNDVSVTTRSATNTVASPYVRWGDTTIGTNNTAESPWVNVGNTGFKIRHHITPDVAANDEEERMSPIDEKQVELLDAMRESRDRAARYAQTKRDRATLMRIQAEALEKESDEIVNEIVNEINEGVPLPEGE